jgi:hypothetical protein
MNAIDHYRLRVLLAQAQIAPYSTYTEGWPRELARRGDAGPTRIDTADGPIAVTSLEEARALLRIHGPPLPGGNSRPIESSLFRPINTCQAPGGSGSSGRRQPPGQSPRNGRGRAAMTFLASALSGGPRDSTALIKAAQSQGISLITLRRMKRALGVVATPIRQDHRVRSWQWQLP